MNQILVKFFKAFLTGGFAAVSAALALGVTVQSLNQEKDILIVLLIAFINGGIHAGVEYFFPTVSLSKVASLK